MNKKIFSIPNIVMTILVILNLIIYVPLSENIRNLNQKVNTQDIMLMQLKIQSSVQAANYTAICLQLTEIKTTLQYIRQSLEN